MILWPTHTHCDIRRELVALALVVGTGMIVGVTGCKDLSGNADLPAGTPSPSFYDTPAGAIGMHNAAVEEFQLSLTQYIIDAGLITDELEDPNTGASPGILLSQATVSDPLDERILPQGTTGGGTSYGNLQNVRAFANQALGALVTYDTSQADSTNQKIARAELYALVGYAEIMLADLFCSGVPLSTLDFQHDFTYHASSKTEQVYDDAIAKFDSAVSLADTSTRVLNLARVGKGRAWLDLGEYDSAATAVAAVPEGFQYQLAINWQTCGCFPNNHLNQSATVSDREGMNGLPFRSSGDVRSAVDTTDTVDGNGHRLPIPLFFPVKYATALESGGYAAYPVADWIEARLIQSEAALHGVTTGRGSWLDQLNALRQTAIAPSLPSLSDPGASPGDSARVLLLFQERAYWLFLTGHRQGDLRRLVRKYGRASNKVYPTGVYVAPGSGLYGTDVNAPIPTSEVANPLFHGCLSRGA